MNRSNKIPGSSTPLLNGCSEYKVSLVTNMYPNGWTLFLSLSRLSLSQLTGNSLTSLMLFIQFWMFSKDFSSVMSYTRMMPWWAQSGEREAKRLDSRSQWEVQSEQKGPMTSAWLSSLLVLQAPCAYHGSSVVGRGNGLEPLLSCCVPAQCTHVQWELSVWSYEQSGVKDVCKGMLDVHFLHSKPEWGAGMDTWTINLVVKKTKSQKNSVM